MHHHLPATPETIRWGSFSASYAPILTVQSGDSVTIECVSGARDAMPAPDLALVVPPALLAIQAACNPFMGAHILTGPVAVADEIGRAHV